MRNIHQKKNDLGRFDSLEHLWRRLPNGASSGDYAHIGNEIFIWDEHQRNWMLDTCFNTDSYLLLEQSGDLDLMGDLRVGGRLTARHHARFKGDVTIEGKLDCKLIKQHDRGFFPDTETLMHIVPSPTKGDWALVGTDERPQLWQCTTYGEWERVGETNLENAFNLEAYNKVHDIVENIANMGYVFQGVAQPETNPHCPNDHNVFYLSSQPGKYIYFDNIEVRMVSVLLWTMEENGQGGWKAKPLLGDFIVDTSNIQDGAVTIEKTTGIKEYIDENDEENSLAIDRLKNRLVGDEQQMVKSITINGTENTKNRPDQNGNVNLVIAAGGGEEGESLADQVQQNSNDIADIKDQLEDFLLNEDSSIVIVDLWLHDNPETYYVQPSGTTWYDPVSKKLYVSDGSEWQETALDTDKVYVDTANNRILGFDGVDLWVIVANQGDKRQVIVCKVWLGRSPSDTQFPAGTVFAQGDCAYDYNHKQLYEYNTGTSSWQTKQLDNSCIYVSTSQNTAYRWDNAVGDMVAISQGVTVDTVLSATSTNPVQNKVINKEVSSIRSTLSTNETRLGSLESGLSSIASALADITNSQALQTLWQALLGTDELVPLLKKPPLTPYVGMKYLNLETGKVMQCTALDGQPSTFVVKLRLQARHTKTVEADQPFVIRPCQGEEIRLLIDAGWDLGSASDLPSGSALSLVAQFKKALEDAGYNGRYTATDETAERNAIIADEPSVVFTIQTINNRPLETLLDEVYRDKKNAALLDVLFVPYSKQQAYYTFKQDGDTEEYYTNDEANVQGSYDSYTEFATQPDQSAIIPAMISINDDADDILAIAEEIRSIATEISSLAQDIVTKSDQEWLDIVNRPSMYGAGATSNLPEDPIEGMCYFDTEIGKPVWAVNTAEEGEEPSFTWLDATGADPYD